MKFHIATQHTKHIDEDKYCLCLDGRDYMFTIQEIDLLHYPEFETIDCDINNLCSCIGDELEGECDINN